MIRTLKLQNEKDADIWTVLVGESSIGHSAHLRYLHIYNPHGIRHLPDSLCKLYNLKFLDDSGNFNLQNLPDPMNNLSNLPFLYVRQTSILSLPDSICDLSQLQVLYLGHCEKLKQLPKDIGNLRSLRKLDLSVTPISSLPLSICALGELQVLKFLGCTSLRELPKEIGNLRSLRKLHLDFTSILSLPESIVNATTLENLSVEGLWVGELEQLPSHIGQLARLERLPKDRYHVGKEKEKGVEELKLMNQPVNDEEMVVKVMEALEPHHALQRLKIHNFGGNKFPDWTMSSNICLSNLVELKMEGLNKICEMVNMEFVSLEYLKIENCPILKKVLMGTPKLRELNMMNCAELEADSVHLLPSLSEEVGLLSIVSQLERLECEYNFFEYFFEKLKIANSKMEKLEWIRLRAAGKRIAALPEGWPGVMNCLKDMYIDDIGPGKFQYLPDGDQSVFPLSVNNISLEINNMLVSHCRCYTITSDGNVECEKIERNNPRSEFLWKRVFWNRK